MMNHKRAAYCLALATLFTLLTMPAMAAQIENVYFPNEYATGNLELKIRGTGLLRYMVFVKAYVGGLYLPEDVPSDAAL